MPCCAKDARLQVMSTPFKPVFEVRSEFLRSEFLRASKQQRIMNYLCLHEHVFKEGCTTRIAGSLQKLSRRKSGNITLTEEMPGKALQVDVNYELFPPVLDFPAVFLEASRKHSGSNPEAKSPRLRPSPRMPNPPVIVCSSGCVNLNACLLLRVTLLAQGRLPTEGDRRKNAPVAPGGENGDRPSGRCWKDWSWQRWRQDEALEALLPQPPRLAPRPAPPRPAPRPGAQPRIPDTRT